MKRLSYASKAIVLLVSVAALVPMMFYGGRAAIASAPNDFTMCGMAIMVLGLVACAVTLFVKCVIGVVRGMRIEPVFLGAYLAALACVAGFTWWTNEGMPMFPLVLGTVLLPKVLVFSLLGALSSLLTGEREWNGA